MTGYSSTQINGEWGVANWEFRSVNHRFLDLTIRLPELLRPGEMLLRDKVKDCIQRGKVDISLQIQNGEKALLNTHLNQNLLQHLISNLNKISEQMAEYTPPQLMDLLRWPEMFQSTEESLSDYRREFLASFDRAILEFIEVRRQEGKLLQEFIMKRLRSIKEEIEKINQQRPVMLQWQRDKLLTRFEQVKLELDPQRLEQEMLIFAQKTDIAEEIDRCHAHVEHFIKTLESGNELGRRLNFLLQEMTREVNTLSAKSIDINITNSAINLKLYIEQIREQVQNIE